MVARVVIAGTASGVGKTTLTVGLARALRRRGLRVAMFKCGPDYLDPTYHARAAGSVCHNLDGWMMGREAVLASFARAARAADIALIEGVMGLFDGASPVSDEGSTAQIAKWLEAPVLLACDASGMARSIAALVHGFGTFDAELRIGGVICNRIGSPSHLSLLSRAVPGKVLGGLGARPELAFPERHLGLRSADEDALPDRLFDAWAEQVEAGVDVEAVLALARRAPRLPDDSAVDEAIDRAPRCVIGVAFDAAFHFYYEDNLNRLARLGARLVRFSPLRDPHLPEVDGLYLGGGYPELHAASLAANASMRREVASFAEHGGPVYAECGGLMYLLDAIRTGDGAAHDMAGVLPGVAYMRDRLQALGYVEVETQRASVLGDAGLRFRGHEFRYSELVLHAAAEHAYSMRKRRGGAAVPEGYVRGNVLGSYVHAHWASNPLAAEGFVNACAAHAARSR